MSPNISSNTLSSNAISPPLVELILAERQIAYAITDADFVVRTVHGNPFLLWGERRGGQASGVGKKITDLAPELLAAEEELAAVATGRIPHLRYQWVNRRGAGEAAGEADVRYVTLSVQAYREAGETQGAEQGGGLLFLAQDMTAQGRMQQKLMQRHNEMQLLKEQLERRNHDLAAANAELRLANEMQVSFLSITAHELRTPLTALYGYLEMFLDEEGGNLTPEQQEYMGLLQASAQELMSAASNLLDVLRINLDRLELVLRPIDIQAVVEKAVERFRPHFEAKSQAVQLRIPDNLPQALCDPVRATQVIGHLLSNAIRLTPFHGTVTLDADLDRSGNFLEIVVRHEDVGLDPGEQAFLFDFERLHHLSGLRQNGTDNMDLSLYISRALVELHGGQIWCAQTPGRGSALHVTFPAVVTSSRREQAPQGAQHGSV